MISPPDVSTAYVLNESYIDHQGVTNTLSILPSTHNVCLENCWGVLSTFIQCMLFRIEGYEVQE